MGYKVQRTGYKVALEEHPGLVVVIKPLSIKQILDLNRLASSVSGFDEEDPGEDALAAFETVLRRFASLIEDWNLEEDDEDETPIPADYDGLTSLGLPFAMEILNAALEGVTQAPRPLSGTSKDGARNAGRHELEDSIPMTPIGLPSPVS
jgi:hypothetical protein